ncbi:MAG: ribbon-helix-helix protein, CopG family [Polyangiales bacterium]
MNLKILISLYKDQVGSLDCIAAAQMISRSAVIRRAVDAFLTQHGGLGELPAARRAQCFGLWRDRAIDALDHERALRTEWDR